MRLNDGKHRLCWLAGGSLELSQSQPEDVPQVGQPGQIKLTGLHLLSEPGVFSLKVSHSQSNLVLFQPPSLTRPASGHIVLLSPRIVARVLENFII